MTVSPSLAKAAATGVANSAVTLRAALLDVVTVRVALDVATVGICAWTKFAAAAPLEIVETPDAITAA